ncbi:hypothetical protein J8I29_08145 [Labrys sp. LIt4]|uniref:hypothetical protein n=1 Tax=Labrys sp. LIt4 TaxID=2821355 RepID=UPI001ADF9528|nr:hypothetical protein [Labrys sp. LIt4]MBP0579272.1 hypothetical protein [Labrys sp. LIt4]
MALLLPGAVLAGPVCKISKEGQQRILQTLCMHQAGETLTSACIGAEGMKMNILEATIFIESLNRCGPPERKLAEMGFTGIAKIYGAQAAMARCVGVRLDVPSMIAEARSRAQKNGKGLPCPAGSALDHAKQTASRYAGWQSLLPSLYQGAGINIDAGGNVSE